MGTAPSEGPMMSTAATSRQSIALDEKKVLTDEKRVAASSFAKLPDEIIEQ
jgi:hypothetical protein